MYVVMFLILVAIGNIVVSKSLAVKKLKFLDDAEIIRLFDNDSDAIKALKELSKITGVKIGYMRPDDMLLGKGLLAKYNASLVTSVDEDILDFMYENGFRGDPSSWTLHDFTAWYKIVHGGKRDYRKE